MEIQDDAVLPPWANPVRFCALEKLVREHLRVVLARPSCVGLCGRHPERRLELPGSPRPRPHDVSDRRDVCRAAPRASFILVKNPTRNRESCGRYETLRGTGVLGVWYVRKIRKCGAVHNNCQRESGGKVSRR